MDQEYTVGQNCIIAGTAKIGNNVRIGHNCIIEDGAAIGDNCYIDSNTIIRSNVTLGTGCSIGANCIIGEYGMDFMRSKKQNPHQLTIGDRALVRSGSILYTGSEIGTDFQTGHQVTIRENAVIGDHVSVGTLSDIQGNCKIGNYVRLHSNVHIGQLSQIDSFVWIFPYVVLTNDPTPPSENFVGVHVNPFAIIAAGAIIMPGMEIACDSLVGAGAVVTKHVPQFAVVAGSPAKQISDVRNVKSKITGEAVYPWRFHFDRAMPWEGVGYEAWYSSLDIDGQNYYCLPEGKIRAL